MTIKLHANIESSRQLPDEIVDAMLCIAKQYHPIFLFSENGKFVIAIENDEFELKQMNQLPQLQKEVTDLLAELQSKVIIESISRSVYFPRNIPSRRFSDIVLEDIVNPVLKSDPDNPLFKKYYFIFQDRLSSAALRVGRIYEHKIEILMNPNHKDRQTASFYDSDISFDVMQEDIDKVEKPGIPIGHKFSSSSSSFVKDSNRQIELKHIVDRLQRKKGIKLNIAMEKIAIETLEFITGIQKRIITQENIDQWFISKCQEGISLEKKATGGLENKNSFVSLTLKRKVASHGTYEKDRMGDYELLVKQIRRLLSGGVKITAQFFPYDANLFLKITLNCNVASGSHQSFEKDIKMCLFAAQLSDEYYLSAIDYSPLLIDNIQYSQEAASVEASSSSSSSSSAIPTSNANLSQAGSSFFRSNQIYRVVAESVDNQIIFCLVVVPSSRDSVLGGPTTNTKYVESESQNLALLITSYLGGELTIIYNRNCNKNITLFQIIVNHSKMTRFDKTAFESIINSELRKRNVSYFIHLKEITFKGYELDRLNTHDASPLCPVGQKVLEIAYKRDYFGNLDAATYIFAPRIVIASDSPVMASGDAHYRLTKRLASVLEKIDIDTISFSSAIEVREYTKALRRACTSTHPMILDLVKALLEFKEELKIDINEPAGYLHYTALHHAARKGNKELYDYLVEKGADPQLKDAKGNSAEDILKQTELSKAASVLKL